MDNKQFKDTVKSIDKGFKIANQNKTTALRALQKAGIITKSGQLAKQYK